MKKNKPNRTILRSLSRCLVVLAACGARAGDAPGEKTVPETVASALHLELFTSATNTIYRVPTPLYLKISNNGDGAVELPVDGVPWGGFESHLEAAAVYSETNRVTGTWAASLRGTGVVLPPHGSVTFRLLDRYFPPGTNTVSFKYHGELLESPGTVVVAASNALRIVVEDKPLDAAALQALYAQFDRCAGLLTTCQFESDEWLHAVVKRTFLVGSPYSGQYIVDRLKLVRNERLRVFYIGILGDLACKSMAVKFGYQRYTAPARDLIQMLNSPEPSAAIRTALIQSLYFFGDTLDAPALNGLRTSLLNHAKDEDAEVRFWALLNLLRTFPDERDRVANRVAEDARLSENHKSILEGAIRGTKGALGD